MRYDNKSQNSSHWSSYYGSTQNDLKRRNQGGGMADILNRSRNQNLN